MQIKHTEDYKMHKNIWKNLEGTGGDTALTKQLKKAESASFKNLHWVADRYA